MSEQNLMSGATTTDRKQARRDKRAARTRAKALAPGRIIMAVLSLPLVVAAVSFSVYIRTSPYERPEALAHLVARFGCDAAGYVGLAPAYRGELGYHPRNDPDGNGVACEAAVSFGSAPLQGQGMTAPAPNRQPSGRMTGGAKFVKP